MWLKLTTVVSGTIVSSVRGGVMFVRKELEVVAEHFRRAIDEAKAEGQFDWKYESYHKDRMRKFPHGCCDDTCDLFCYYLANQYNIVLQQISGDYRKEGTRHNWLETTDGLIIDLTGDQFAGRRIMYAEPDDGFYHQMRDRKEVSSYCILNSARLKRDYEVIMQYMKGEGEDFVL